MSDKGAKRSGGVKARLHPEPMTKPPANLRPGPGAPKGSRANPPRREQHEPRGPKE